MANRASMNKMEEYRGGNNWKGLFPAVEAPRVWDEGFRSFLVRYGMLNQVVYDVFIKGDDDDKDENGLRGTSRFNDNLKAFSEKGLEFSYVTKRGVQRQEYDFTGDYQIVGNIVSSSRSFFSVEDNWFGFVALSSDRKEMVIVFRGTETTKEWIENATLGMTKLDGAPKETGWDALWNRNDLMCHIGFQQLYTEQTVKGGESPKETVHRLVQEYKTDIDKITVLGHSLGAAITQVCAIDLVHSGVAGDIPVLALAWAAPRIGNPALAAYVESLQPRLRILRIRNPLDEVTNVPPNWLWTLLLGGYKAMGTELNLSNTQLQEEGIVKADDGNSPNHNLEMYLHNIDPTRDVALMNKMADVIPDEYARKHSISPEWNIDTWPQPVNYKNNGSS